jgi:hyperosmotically inducible periplasmic protein
MKRYLSMISMAAFVAGSGLAAYAASAANFSTEAAANQASGNKTESRLAHEVRHELVTLPYYNVFDNLAFRIDGSTVTLLGQVTRPTLKSAAEKVVKNIEGITHVNNEIEVLPLSPSDDRIRQAEYRAIYSQPALNQYALRAVPPIHIIVKNGHVTLEGAVANEGDKNIAGVQANSVPGVFSVTNNLRVDQSSEDHSS